MYFQIEHKQKTTANNLAILFGIEEARRSFDSIMDHREIDLASLREFNLYPFTMKNDIFDCRIESLNTDSFDNLSNLVTLRLKLQPSTTTSVDLKSIEKLIKLNVLYIYNYSIKKSKLVLDLSVFENLEEYYLLDFEVDLDEFRCLNTLRFLYLGSCKLEHFNSKNFSEMTCLLVLCIFGCEIEMLDADVFANLVNLKILTLCENSLTALNQDTFKTLTCLEKLNLSNNQITVLKDNIFAHLVNLKHLSLDGNRLTALHEDTFKTLTCLEDLDLSYNQITVLKDNIFETNTKLQKLDLSK